MWLGSFALPKSMLSRQESEHDSRRGQSLFLNHRPLYGEGNGTPLQYSCLENPMDGGAWLAKVHGVTKSRTRLSDFTFTHWRRKWQPTPVFLPGESQGRGSLVGYVYGVAQSQTQLQRLSSSSSSRPLYNQMKDTTFPP